MIEISKADDQTDYYDGSRMFAWLADICGLSIDLMNFLVCQLLALFFASFFRSYFHPSKVSTSIRHAFGLSLGLYFGYICFGQQAIHIIGLPAVCYLIIRTQNPQIMQRLVMIVSMTYLSVVHFHRIYFDYGSYALDITGPLMIITQKVTLLTFSIHDGLTRDENTLTKSQKSMAIRKLPSPLEFFAYVLHFQGLMAGPLVFYKDYMEFIDGTNILKHKNPKSELDQNGQAKEIVVEPSPMKAVIKKIIGSVICAYIFKNWVTVYPIKTLTEDGFVENTSFFYKFWFMMISTTIVRFKYYHAWLLADAICNNSGLGFNGYEKDGNPKWNKITNINVISFELATNLRDAIGSWNLGTNQWLRLVVYERVPKKYATLFTFCLSALWHGFYPGYYLTFVLGALFVTTARKARKLFRHRFQQNEYKRVLYDILTVLTTRIFMGYLTFPFVLLEFNASIRLYLKLYLCLHIISIVTIYVLPKLLRGESHTRNSHKTATATSETTQNGINHSEQNGKHFINNKLNIEIFTKNCNDDNDNFNDNCTDNNMNRNCDINLSDKYDENDRMHGSKKIDFSHISNSNKNDNHLSHKIRKRIDSETRNIEEFIDKTVTGIVELKDDLMRVNDHEMYTNSDGLRKRNGNGTLNGDCREVEAFLRKEISMNQKNVLPAVLSNGHAD